METDNAEVSVRNAGPNPHSKIIHTHSSGWRFSLVLTVPCHYSDAELTISTEHSSTIGLHHRLYAVERCRSIRLPVHLSLCLFNPNPNHNHN